MANQKFGEITWNETYEDSNGQKPQKDLFLRLDDGSNEVRILTNPFQYLVHRYKKEGDKGYGVKVQCSAPNGSCPLCEAGDKAKRRWLFGVISRKTGAYKILDVSYSVFQGIKALTQKKAWGAPTLYDIDITKNSQAKTAQEWYNVSPVAKEPLSAADQQIADAIDFEDLKRRSAPPTPEQVQKRLDKINGGESTVAPAAAPAAPQQTLKKAAKGKVAQVAMEDDTEDFPSYDDN